MEVGRTGVLIDYEVFKACLAARAYKVLLAEHPQYREQFDDAARHHSERAAEMLESAHSSPQHKKASGPQSTDEATTMKAARHSSGHLRTAGRQSEPGWIIGLQALPYWR